MDKSAPMKWPASKIVCGFVIDGHSINVNPREINFWITYVSIANCNSAASPIRQYVRVPQILAIFSGAHQPFMSNKSHWARGVKSNFGGVPTRRISTLYESSGPIGADASGICGTRCSKSVNNASFSANSAKSAAISSPICLDFAISGALSVAVGISRVILFFSAVIFCVTVFNSRTRASNSKILSTLSSNPLTRQAFFTASGFSRINLMSSITLSCILYVCIYYMCIK